MSMAWASNMLHGFRRGAVRSTTGSPARCLRVSAKKSAKGASVSPPVWSAAALTTSGSRVAAW
eukprot:6594621-Prymnesium_polylepis.1